MTLTSCQLTFFGQQNRRHGHHSVSEWLMDLAKTVGIAGSTSTLGYEGTAHSGKPHSAKFFKLADQPVEITRMVNEVRAESLFDQLQAETKEPFNVEIAVEYGSIGAGMAKS